MSDSEWLNALDESLLHDLRACQHRAEFARLVELRAVVDYAQADPKLWPTQAVSTKEPESLCAVAQRHGVDIFLEMHPDGSAEVLQLIGPRGQRVPVGQKAITDRDRGYSGPPVIWPSTQAPDTMRIQSRDPLKAAEETVNDAHTKAVVAERHLRVLEAAMLRAISEHPLVGHPLRVDRCDLDGLDKLAHSLGITLEVDVPPEPNLQVVVHGVRVGQHRRTW